MVTELGPGAALLTASSAADGLPRAGGQVRACECACVRAWEEQDKGRKVTADRVNAEGVVPYGSSRTMEQRILRHLSRPPHGSGGWAQASEPSAQGVPRRKPKLRHRPASSWTAQLPSLLLGSHTTGRVSTPWL